MTYIANKVKNISIKWNVEVALDCVQYYTCEIVQIWKDLEKTFKEDDQPITILKHIKNHYNQAMTDSHFLANLLDPGQDINPCPGQVDRPK